jgi:hypothetical protein
VSRIKPTPAGACNINAAGRALRLVAGLITLSTAVLLVALLLWGPLADDTWWWAVAAAALAGGAFMTYEGWAGWCALRAMGWRTPI